MIEESITSSRQGRVKLEEVSKTIRGITEQNTKAKDLVNSVHLGSMEQARGVEQIAKSITQIEQVTQTSAASAEEAASAGQELNSLAGDLKSIVDKLEALVGGGERG
jgi:methyl-accepting chemotaxis protein/methyl-accepting chemotaxis protein-1 (serine sensor receptor)